ncbi:MAG: AAC(3) family N-acetyltransferase [Planctomycetota bacterium]
MLATLSQSDIENGLRGLGLKHGDLILLHSSLASLGQVEGGPETVVRAMLNVVGKEGTLVVPTFGDLGILTKIVEKHPDAIRSIHPLASVAAIGKDAKALCQDHWKAELAHEKNTPYTRLTELGGWILLLGVDQDRNTTLHTVEEILRLPYLEQTSERTFETPEGSVTKSWPYFPGPHRDFISCDSILMASGKMKMGRIGNSVARLIKSRELIDIMVEYGRRHPDWALCDNPNCSDCVRQRAALRRHRLTQESFHLAASSRLAGRYVPEMIENLKASGIGAVELDWVQGRPAYLFKDKRLASIREEFAAAGITPISLRVLAVTDNDEAILDAAKSAGIHRVLLPLSHRAKLNARLAQSKNLEVSFYSANMTSSAASQLLLEMASDSLTPQFVFNAAHFAKLGERPFLKSYKQKLRRFVDQLDIEDATFAGENTTLAQGNAEIKEMISILRCASFAGWFVFSCGDRPVESLSQTCSRFMRLIETM